MITLAIGLCGLAFALNVTLAILAGVAKRWRRVALHATAAVLPGLVLALVAASWWDCRDGAPPHVTVDSAGVAHIDRLCPGQSATVTFSRRAKE